MTDLLLTGLFEIRNCVALVTHHGDSMCRHRVVQAFAIRRHDRLKRVPDKTSAAAPRKVLDGQLGERGRQFVAFAARDRAALVLPVGFTVLRLVETRIPDPTQADRTYRSRLFIFSISFVADSCFLKSPWVSSCCAVS